MRCPLCQLENLPTALRCDCGFDFEGWKFRQPPAPIPPAFYQEAPAPSAEERASGISRINRLTAYRLLTAILLCLGFAAGGAAVYLGGGGKASWDRLYPLAPRSGGTAMAILAAGCFLAAAIIIAADLRWSRWAQAQNQAGDQ